MNLFDEIANDAAAATAVLEQLGRGGFTGVGVLDALAEGQPTDFVTWEHDPGGLPHLVEHAHRALANLEQLRSGGGFADLGMELRARLAESVASLVQCDLVCVVRLALVLLDFAKGGDDARRRAWEGLGIDLTVHNEAAAAILDRDAMFAAVELSPMRRKLLLQIVRTHGLAGQHARGETPVAAFRPWVGWLTAHSEQLGAELGVDMEQAVALATRAMHVVDVCDTEAVRHGLVDARLFADLESVQQLWVQACAQPERLDEGRPLDERFARLRHQAMHAGEPPSRLKAAIDAVAAHRGWIDELLPNAQLWYFEPATHRLSAEAALRLLILGLGLAHRDAAVDCQAPFHLSFQPLVDALGAPNAKASYRVRVVEALLANWNLDSLAAGEIPRDVLGGFTPRIGGTTAVAVELQMSEEAEALVTLAALYEQRSSVAFHQILKLLCDAYGLRKDEFDRLANEAQYLATMNTARSDKERMLDFVRPGVIVEIGPGGGVVLDLLEARFPDSDIVGIDVSEAVVEELERRRKREERSWRIIEGDAFELPQHVEGVDTVIFCSLLHEIYSYVERDGRKFTMTPVRELLVAAYESLHVGGRIVIRDGVRPPPGRRVIEFIDPEGPEVLRRFATDFEGRRVAVEWLDERRAAMSTADAMEFLYCYTWGPSSYPYEVRELYGIMERDEYEETVLRWLPGSVAVQLPNDLRSYLQPGYITGLGRKVRLTDEHGSAVELPDSNAIWVFERT